MIGQGDERASVFATLALVLVGVAILSVGGVVVSRIGVRGVRNNNPGNLRLTGIAWKGKVPNAENTDREFEQFRDGGGYPGHVWGLRALYMDVRGDVLRDGLNTVTKLIHSYAPPSENNTRAYIDAVARAIDKGATDALVLADLPGVIKAIVAHENRGHRYPDEDVAQAIRLAG